MRKGREGRGIKRGEVGEGKEGGKVAVDKKIERKDWGVRAPAPNPSVLHPTILYRVQFVSPTYSSEAHSTPKSPAFFPKRNIKGGERSGKGD